MPDLKTSIKLSLVGGPEWNIEHRQTIDAYDIVEMILDPATTDRMVELQPARAPQLRRVVLLHDARTDRAAAQTVVGTGAARFVWIDATAAGARHTGKILAALLQSRPSRRTAIARRLSYPSWQSGRAAPCRETIPPRLLLRPPAAAPARG